MNDIQKSRTVLVGPSGAHEVRLEVHPFFGFRTYVDGVRISPKKSFKILERKKTIEVSVGDPEPHNVTFEMEFQTRYNWECTILVDGKQVRQFEDAYFKGLDRKQRLKWAGWFILGYAVLVLAIVRLLHK